MSRFMRRAVPAAVSLLFGLVVAVTLAEVALRMMPDRHRETYIVSDPVFHHRLQRRWSGVVRGAPFATNSIGLRDHEITFKGPGTHRILMMGDSFTEAAGLPDEATVAKRVERGLNAMNCGRTFEVLNAGVGSYSPILEYLQLRHLGLGLHPDMVVLNFDMTDVHDDVVRTATARLDADGLPVAVPVDRRLETALLMPPIAKPRALAFLDPVEEQANRLRVYQELRRSSLGRVVFGPLKLTPERMQALGLVGNIRYDIEAITRDDGEYPGGRPAWMLTERYLQGINRLARDREIAFALVVYPHAQQVSATASPGGRRAHGLGPGLYASERPFTILEDLGRRAGFPVINLLQTFRTREKTDGPLFRADDIHHTEVGARVFGDGILGALMERRLVPCGSDQAGAHGRKPPQQR
jgi:hypothetical protein